VSIKALASLIVFLMFASGCSIQQTVRKDFTFEANPKEGLLLASVTLDNSDQKGNFDVRYHYELVSDDLAIGRTGYPRGFNLNNTSVHGVNRGQNDFTTARGSVIAQALQAGKYRFTRWSMALTLNQFVYPSELNEIEFTIKEGEATYIGNLHIFIRESNKKFNSGHTPVVIFNDERVRDISVIKGFVPVVDKVKYQVPDTNTWVPN